MTEKMPKKFQEYWYKRKPFPTKEKTENNQDMYSEDWNRLLQSIKEASLRQWK